MERRTFDVCVVGAGMWGSAAARHISEDENIRVCLLGPEEPSKEDFQEAEVLGSHYDEGRITREADPDQIWATLAQRSIARYRDLEQKTGITFYSEVGCLSMGQKASNYLNSIKQNCERLGIGLKDCNKQDVRTMFPYLKADASKGYLYTERRSGYISPRGMISAQKTATHLQGCEIIDDAALEVRPTGNQAVGRRNLCIVTKKSGYIYANRVLLCTGAFTNFHRILPDDSKLDIKVETEMVVKAEVTGKELAKLRKMPVIIMFSGVLPDEKDFYLLPPIRYPNAYGRGSSRPGNMRGGSSRPGNMRGGSSRHGNIRSGSIRRGSIRCGSSRPGNMQGGSRGRGSIDTVC